jgi:hypothetical protein
MEENGVSQVNVNTPGGEPAPVRDGSGYGFIVGILVAILVIALLLWLLVFNGGNGGNNTTDNGDDTPEPTGYHLVLRG